MLFFNIRPQKVVCAPSHPATAFQKEKVRSSWWVFLTEEWTSSHVHTVLVKTAPLRHSLLACRWLTARYCGFVFCTPFLPSHLQGMLSIHSLRAAPLYWKELIFSPLFCSSLTPFPICSVLRAITIWNGVCWWASLQRQGQNSIPPDPLPRHSSPTPLSGMLQQISTLRFSLYCCWPIPYTANISTWVPDTAVLTSFWTSLLRSAQACFADVPRVIMSSQND